MNWLDEVKWDAQGLVPVIAQEVGTGDVLMFAWMNREALAATEREGRAVYWSRSRGRLWHKGEESGNLQKVHEIRMDCDNDVILLQVTQPGSPMAVEGHGHAHGAVHGNSQAVACHTGRHSCFFQRLDGGRWQSVEPPLVDPEKLYGHAH